MKKKIGLGKLEIEPKMKSQMSLEEKELWPFCGLSDVQSQCDNIIWIALFGDKWIRVMY
jgi:hypothetical protein